MTCIKNIYARISYQAVCIYVVISTVLERRLEQRQSFKVNYVMF